MRTSFFSKKDVDMTKGNIPKLIIGFFIPMAMGLFLQQLYNSVDMIIVGQFASSQAMAAVGGTGTITNTFVMFCSGISIGASVIISQYYGKNDSVNIKKAVSSSVVLAFIMSAVMTVLGLILARPMLVLMKSNDDIIGLATTYLLIYFAGVSGVIMYNMLTSIFRAVGDSTRPLIYLLISSVVNIFLDLLLVAVFNLGVVGAAVATIIAQFVSAIIAFIYLIKIDRDYKIDLKNLKMDKEITKSIILVGFPAGLQSSITGISNTFIHSYINAFGSDYESGFSIFIKLDHFITVFQTSFGYAITSFVGQNVGANQIKRACKGVSFTLIASLVVTAVVILPIVIFAEPLSSAFTSDKAVTEAAKLIIVLITPFQMFTSINATYMASLRGYKKTRISMFIVISTFVIYRILHMSISSAIFPKQILPILLAFPFAWVIASFAHFIAWIKCPIFKANRKLKKHPELENLTVEEILKH